MGLTPAPGETSAAWRNTTAVGERVVRLGTLIVVAAAGLLILAAVFLATGALFVLFADGVQANLGSIRTIPELQVAVQRVFAGVLLLVLGLELLETLKNYFTDSRIRTEIILVVALIAIARHIMLLDVEHTSGAVLLGSAALTLALAVSYWLVRGKRERAAGPDLPQ
jgi:uncharacterized membrane protein (DUF373 family)